MNRETELYEALARTRKLLGATLIVAYDTLMNPDALTAPSTFTITPAEGWNISVSRLK